MSQSARVDLDWDDRPAFDMLSLDSLELLIDAELARQVSAGYWDSEIKVVQSKDLLRVVLDKGSLGEISRANVHFPALRQAWQEELGWEFMLGSDSISAQVLDDAQARMRSLGWRTKGNRKVLRDEAGNHHLMVPLISPEELTLAATIGYNRNGGDTLNWIGNIQAIIPNLGTPGRAIRLNWRRTQVDAEYLRFKYTEPRILRQPVYLSIDASREVVDGYYQVLQQALDISWTFDWNQSLSAAISNNSTRLTLAGSELNSQWETNRFQSLGLGYRNSDLLIKGPALLGLTTTVNQELRSNPQATKQLAARSQLDWPLSHRLSLVQRGALMLQTGGDPTTNPGLLQSLGGTETIRGYSENHIRVANYAFMQTEMRLKTGAGSSLFFFTDWGTFGTRRKEGEMLGVGMGVALTTRGRPLSIQLAGQPGTTLGNMLVHISFETESLWIDR